MPPGDLNAARCGQKVERYSTRLPGPLRDVLCRSNETDAKAEGALVGHGKPDGRRSAAGEAALKVYQDIFNLVRGESCARSFGTRGCSSRRSSRSISFWQAASRPGGASRHARSTISGAGIGVGMVLR